MKSWFVVRLKTGAESRVYWHSNNQGFDVYLPSTAKKSSTLEKCKRLCAQCFLDICLSAWMLSNNAEASSMAQWALLGWFNLMTPFADHTVFLEEVPG